MPNESSQMYMDMRMGINIGTWENSHVIPYKQYQQQMLRNPEMQQTNLPDYLRIIFEMIMRTLRDHELNLPDDIILEFTPYGDDSCSVRFSLDRTNMTQETIDLIHSIKGMLERTFEMLEDLNQEFGLYPTPFDFPIVPDNRVPELETQTIIPDLLVPMSCMEAAYAIDDAWEDTKDYPYPSQAVEINPEIYDLLERQGFKPHQVQKVLRVLPQLNTHLTLLTQLDPTNPNNTTEHIGNTEPLFFPREVPPVISILGVPVLLLFLVKIFHNKLGLNRRN